jgi:uncharacterized protein YndB with AHSA1/START domain
MIRRVSLLLLLLLLVALLAPASPARPGATAPDPAGATASDPAGAPPPLPPPPGAAEAARLASGEVLLASRPAAPRPLAEEIGRGIFDAPPERVFAAVTDFAHYQEWVPFVHRSDAAPLSDGSVVSFQSLTLPFPLGRRYYKIRARHEVSGEGGGRAWRAWWRYVPGTGNVADHYGWWVLVPFGGGRTLGTCALYTEPGRGLPAWAVHRGTAETMPYVFSGLRQQVRRSRYDRP